MICHENPVSKIEKYEFFVTFIRTIFNSENTRDKMPAYDSGVMIQMI